MDIQVFSSIAQLCITFIATLLVIHTLRANRDLKSVDTSIECQKRFEELIDSADDVHSRKQAIRYYDRFWGIQADQFTHWRNGMLPDDTYLHWMKRRREKYQKNSSIGDMGFVESWKQNSDHIYADSKFRSFMNEIFESSPEVRDAEERRLIYEIMRRNKRRWWEPR